MKKEMPKIKVLEKQAQQILFECSLDEIEQAYKQAAHFEELGLDVIIDIPTLSETLSQSLGHGLETKAAYFESLEEEIEHHEGSCCFKDQTTKKLN